MAARSLEMGPSLAVAAADGFSLASALGPVGSWEDLVLGASLQGVPERPPQDIQTTFFFQEENPCICTNFCQLYICVILLCVYRLTSCLDVSG